MLVNIALISSILLQVKADWVEISQQHYRKPYRPIPVKGKLQVTTETVKGYSERNRIYSNQTLNQDWENEDLLVPSNVASIEQIRRPDTVVKVRNDKRPTGNFIKPALQVAKEKDVENEKIIDHYDYDVRHEDSHFVYEIPGKDITVNKRRPLNEHNPNDRVENNGIRNRHTMETEMNGNKVVRLDENTKSEDPRRSNRLKEGGIRKIPKIHNIRSSTTQPPRNINISKLKDNTHSNNRMVDIYNHEEKLNDNKQNPFKVTGLSSGGIRRRIYFFDPPKTYEHEYNPLQQSEQMKNTGANKHGIQNPIGSAISHHQNPEKENVQLVVTPTLHRNKKPSDLAAAFKPANTESEGSFPVFTKNTVKVLEEIPSSESNDYRPKEHINMYSHEADSENEDSVLVDTPLVQTADDKNPFITNHYHNINHGNIRRIDFFATKTSEGDIVEFNENINKSPGTLTFKNKNKKPDNTVAGTDDEGTDEFDNSNDKFVFTNVKDTDSPNRVHIKQPYKSIIQKVQFPEKILGLSPQSGVKYPDIKDLPMEHKQINNNGERKSEYPTYLASETPPIEQNSDDDDALDTEITPIRRLDISSLTSANIPEFITKQEPPQDTHEMYKDFIETESTTQKIFTRRLTTVAVKVEESTPHWADDDEKEITDKVTDKLTTNENVKSDNKDNSQDEKEKKPNPLENIVKFMKVVSETISKNTKRSIKGKVRYLEELRDTILTNIEDHIDSHWPNDHPRGTRGARAARGHVDFPSSEGALMTISFLTFAVFLIKLVLQVIHTYKNKSMMVTPAVYAVSRMADTLRSQPDNTND